MKRYHLSIDFVTAVNIILGIVLIVNPSFSTNAVCNILGIVSLLWAAISFIQYFSTKKFGISSKFEMFQGLAGAVLCFIFFFAKSFLTRLIPLIVGLTIGVQSISKIKLALLQKKNGVDKWLLALILNIAGLLVGLCLVINPFSSLMTVIRFIGIALVINGIIRFISDFFLIRQIYNMSNTGTRPDIIDIPYNEDDNS
ncbi:MAG: DUF308 domain-containing protein [Oscillospiraceae bacterium]|nr:DUF308 domain-containing protein [Oscillospiraceae bacterium]